MQWSKEERKSSRSCSGNGTWRNLFSNAREKVAILITIAIIVFSSSSSSSSADDFEWNFAGKVWAGDVSSCETNSLRTSPRRMESTKLWRTIAFPFRRGEHPRGYRQFWKRIELELLRRGCFPPTSSALSLPPSLLPPLSRRRAFGPSGELINQTMVAPW